MMDGFTPISFAKRGDVSIGESGISIPVSRMQMFPDGRCNCLENGAMVAFQPKKNGNIRISRLGKSNEGSGRIWNVGIVRRIANTVGVTLGKRIKLNTLVDDGCLVFTKLEI